MITFALIGLFMIQLISIFVIILLYSKLAKFKDLELRQDRLVREMDDAIGAYLLEMRDENDRFLQELKTAPAPAQQPNRSAESAVEPVLEVNPQTVESLLTETRKVVPKAVAANVYSKHKAQQQVEQEPISEPLVEVKQQQSNLPSFEQEVLAYNEQGLSIEEIAKKTQRGKTEIELLIKFHA